MKSKAKTENISWQTKESNVKRWLYCNLISFRFSAVIEWPVVVVVDKQPVHESLVKIIAEEDRLLVVVDRHATKVTVELEVEPVVKYRNCSRKRIVSELIGVVIGVAEQLLYARLHGHVLARVHNANQRLRHVRWNQFQQSVKSQLKLYVWRKLNQTEQCRIKVAFTIIAAALQLRCNCGNKLTFFIFIFEKTRTILQGTAANRTA